MLKWFIRIGLALILLVVILLAGTLIFIDHVAKVGIQFGATQALGVDTTLDKIRIGLLSGKATLKGLNVAEPPGFKTPHFLNLAQGSVAISLPSLTKDVIEIPQLELSGIDMYIEKDKDGKPNYQVIMDNQKQHETQKTSTGKKFVIRDVTIRDVTLHADVLPIGGPLLVKVPELKLKNVGTAGENGVDMAELVNVLVKATLSSALANGKNILPNDLVADMDKGLQNLSSLTGTGAEAIGNLGKQITSGVGAGLDNVGNLFGNKKDQKK